MPPARHEIMTRADRIANALALVVPMVGVALALIFQW